MSDMEKDIMNAEEKIMDASIADEALESVSGGKSYDPAKHGYTKTRTQHVDDSRSDRGLTFRNRDGSKTGYFCGNNVEIWVKRSDTFTMSYDAATGLHNVTFVKAYRHGHHGYVNIYYVR